MQLTRTRNPESVKYVLTHPEIYPLIGEEGSPAPEDLDVSDLVQDDHYYFLLATEAEQTAGVVIFHLDGEDVYQAHLNVLPEFRGRGRGLAIARDSVKWMFSHTPCRAITARIPVKSDCEPVLNVALSIGMNIVKIIEASYSFGGELYDEYDLILHRSTFIGD